MHHFLSTKGKKIIDSSGKETFLRGFCLGGWLMQENFITGYPGTEQEFRRELTRAAGREKSEYFFSTFLDYFITEEDISFIKGLGATAVRIPFNYRHFEDDSCPYKYKKKGFFYLDKVINWCKKYKIYAILDMHAVPGYQNRDWHSDNYIGESFLWRNRIYQERFYRLWEHISDHYKDEQTVAGYDLMNEPVAEDEEEKKSLNQIYKTAVKRIRKIDKNHIIFLKGNMWGMDFSSFEPPFAKNLVYSSHFYARTAPAGYKYPSRISGESYNRDSLKKEMDKRDAFTRRYNLPMWVGEFGAIFLNQKETQDKIRLLNDQISIFNERGYSWTIWSYKDIGQMGTRYVRSSSPWMRFTAEMRKEKVRLGCDLWSPSGKDFSMLVDEITSLAILSEGGEGGILKSKATTALSRVFSSFLLEKFARKLAGLSKGEMKTLLSSFHLKECLERKELSRLLSHWLKE